MVDFNPEYVKNLPDAYSKSPSSNNAKILEIEKHEANQLRAAISQIHECLDIEKATGATLDLYGEMLGQKRGFTSDSVYLALIKTRIMRNLANGDYNSIINALSLVFSCEPSDFQLKEDPNTAAVEIDGLPVDYINKSGLTAMEAITIIRGLIPAGVLLRAIEFGGTFEFGDSATEYDAEKGFGNIEQTLGGYLGLAASGTASDLPI